MPKYTPLRLVKSTATNIQVSPTLLSVDCHNTKVNSKHRTMAHMVTETKLLKMSLSILFSHSLSLATNTQTKLHLLHTAADANTPSRQTMNKT